MPAGDSVISIITPFGPSHEPFILQAYHSLTEQDHENWEWILVPNNGAAVPGVLGADSRVKVHEFAEPGINIGKLKRFACERVAGDVIVEFDADDILLLGALAGVSKAFEDSAVQFVYSNDAYFREGTWAPTSFNEFWGWRHRDFEHAGHKLTVNVNFPLTAHSLRQVFFSPDHLRAWRTKAYWETGGHDATLSIGDDHDLMCRFYIKYGARGFKGIDEVLYLYRKHDKNSCTVHNASIQKQTEKNYCKYRTALSEKWAEENGLPMLDFGGRFHKFPRYLSVDIEPPADVVCDLNQTFPWEDNSIGVIRASHVAEHLVDPIHFMNECHRVLAPGGWLLMEVPSADGRGAFQDPTHKSFWNENSFWYYTTAQYASFIRPQYKGRFQASRVVTYYPNAFFKEHEIPCVQADLICLKPPYDDHPPGGARI